MTKPRVNQPEGQQNALVFHSAFGDTDSGMHCVKFAHDDNFLACGYGDGAVRIYNLERGRLVYTLQQMSATEDENMPVTAMQWRPETAYTKTTNVLVTAQADGALKHWHTSSGKCLHTI